jgi:hypothetical protein
VTTQLSNNSNDNDYNNNNNNYNVANFISIEFNLYEMCMGIIYGYEVFIIVPKMQTYNYRVQNFITATCFGAIAPL